MSTFTTHMIITTILFGISAQMLLLDIHIKALNGTRRTFFIAGNLLVLVINAGLSTTLPVDDYMRLYVLFVHIPIFLIFWMTAGLSAIKVLFALFTAVFLIYPANMVMTILSKNFNWTEPTVLFSMYVTLCMLILLSISRYFRTNFNYLIRNYSGRSFIKLCLLPLAYYMANYRLGLYNYADVRTAGVISLRHLIFVITLIAYVLILDIAKSAKEKEAAQGAKIALTLLLDSANHQLKALQDTQEQTLVYRHDMRHHLALVGGYLAEGNVEQAERYIKLTQKGIEDITPDRYCENNTVNLILSYFVAKAKRMGVALAVEAELQQSLPVAETELCALLSNGLDNAVAAAAQVADEAYRMARISCQQHKGNLLIFIENSYSGDVVMANGLPQASQDGHGFGSKSMAMIVGKYNGYCAFEAQKEIFTLRIVLPLEPKNIG